MGNDRVDAAFEYLRMRGEIENRGSDHRPVFWLKRDIEAPSDDE